MISKQLGFSLLEVLISFILIGIASLSLVKLQVYVEQKAGYAAQSIEALHYADRQMEFFQTRTNILSGATNLIPFDDLADPIYCLNKSHPDAASAALSGSQIQFMTFLVR